MVQNPNWPVLDFAVSFPSGPTQSCLQPNWTSVLERTETQYAAQPGRGKQYELDQVQPGTYTLTLRNDDGVLDPDNTASPYAPWVTIYRLFRARAQYPATPNLLTQNQSTAGEATPTPNLPQVENPWAAGSVPPPWAVYQPYPTTVVVSGSAWQGSQVFQTAVPSTAVAPYAAVGMQGWSVAPGLQYAFTTHARVTSVTATGSLAVQWLDVNGNVLGQTIAATVPISNTIAYTTLTVSDTAPARAAAAIVLINIATATASTAFNLVHDGWDVRKNTLTAGYSTPGVWYPIHTGYIERWPQAWASQGNYGTVALTIVDYFANLANTALLAPFKADLMALNPNFLYSLDEAVGTNAFADLTNKRGNAIVNRPNLGNVITAGQSLASADNAPRGPDNGTAITGAFLGTAGPVVHSASLFGTDGYQTFSGYLGLPPDPVTGLTGPPQTGAFTRLIAARVTDLRVDGQYAWFTPGMAIYARIASNATVSNGVNSTFKISGIVSGGGNTTGPIDFDLPSPGFVNQDTTVSPNKITPTVYDSDWHLFAISLSADSKTVILWTDSDTGYPYPQTSPVRPPAGAVVSGYTDAIGAVTIGPSAGGNWIGDLALACELPFAMTAGVWATLAQSWRNCWSTVSGNPETSDERYQRILNWLSYTGPARISTGICKSYGPASDIAVAADTPALALAALENVTETEAGNHFIGADGAIVFQSRADRYNRSPVVIFGERDDLGEIPYLMPQTGTDFDPTRVANDVQITAQYGNALYRTLDTASRNLAGTITFTRTVNSIDPNELTAAKQYYLQQLKNPATRLQALTFDVGANPAIWAALLSLEIGMCVGWNRRPSNAPMISLTGFIEQIAWTIDDEVKATCTVQISNTKGRNNYAQWNTFRYAPDAGSITPSANMTAAQTTVTLVTASGSTAFTNTAAAYPLTIQIDQEQITLTAAPGSTSSPQTFTIARGVNGTTATTHLATAAVSLVSADQYAY